MMYKCAEHICILTSYVCDGVFDCPDQSDERNCKQVQNTNNTSLACVDLYYHCRSRECIPRHCQCDRQADCDDASDEKDCPTDRREWGIVLQSRNIESFTSKVSIKTFCLHI